MRRRPPTLQQAAKEDIERQRDRDSEELYPHGYPDDLRPPDVRFAAHLKRGTRVLLAGAGLVAAATTFAGSIIKAWKSWRSGTVAPADLPAHGSERLAVDRVENPDQLPPGAKDH